MVKYGPRWPVEKYSSTIMRDGTRSVFGGLFDWYNVRRLIENGQLHTHMKKENRVIWVTPSKAAWETKIKPLIDKSSLEELTCMAGW